MYKQQAAAESRKAEDVVTIGRQAALKRLEALAQLHVVEHRPKPERAKPGQRPMPVAPGPTKEQAYAAVLSTPEGRKLFEATRT